MNSPPTASEANRADVHTHNVFPTHHIREQKTGPSGYFHTISQIRCFDQLIDHRSSTSVLLRSRCQRMTSHAAQCIALLAELKRKIKHLHLLLHFSKYYLRCVLLVSLSDLTAALRRNQRGCWIPRDQKSAGGVYLRCRHEPNARYLLPLA